MGYRIVADSCTDYPDTHEGLRWVKRVALTIYLGKDTYRDDENLDTDALLSQMKRESKAPTSACPSPGEYMEACGKGEEDVYMVVMSDKVSGSCQSAMVAAEMMRAKEPDRNVHVFNTLSAAAGEVAVCLKIRELAQRLPFSEVVEKVEDFIRSMTTLFVLEDLSVLKKGGRLSHLQALLTTALRVKLVMGTKADGSIDIKGKALSMERAMLSLVNMIKEKCLSIVPGERSIVITHCNCIARAQMVREAVEKYCGFKEVLICRTSGISTMYANDGGVIVGF